MSRCHVDTRNFVHKQMRAKELHAYTYMDKSFTDILWLTNELGDTHKNKSGFETYKTSLNLEMYMACFAVLI